jgi:hypothetical protein
MEVREITACRSCGSSRLDTVLDLGDLCVSDFPRPGESEDRAPLELVVCADCSLVQLRHTVERDRLYRNYYYRSGTNEAMVAALRDVVDDECRRVPLRSGDVVIDIGCNDGTMLEMFPQGLHRVGFEPSNLARVAAQRFAWGIVFPDYFPPKIDNYAHYLPEQAKIITSIACFYDVDDPNAFVAAIKEWLHPDGGWIVQFQDLHKMLSVNGFDNICHEHLTYWGMAAFTALLARHGLQVEACSDNNVNGGSVRYVVKHGTRQPPPVDPIHAVEFQYQLADFAVEVAGLRRQTIALLRRLQDEGKSVLGVAASTKGNTTLQYYGITPDLLPAIVDRNPDKHGRVTTGTHIPIISEEEMWERKPDYLLALAWHFIEPFRERYAAFEQAGGKWIVPLPELTVIGRAQTPSTPAPAGLR